MENSTTFLEQLLNRFLFTRHNSCTNAGHVWTRFSRFWLVLQVVLVHVGIISLDNSYIESETLSEYEIYDREVM